MQVANPLDHLLVALDHSTRDDSVRLPVHITPDPFNPDGPKKIGGTAVVREPVGVVAGITGYNFPFLINLAKTVPALLAGNTLVLRPSPFIPFSALLFGEIANEIGPPRGVRPPRPCPGRRENRMKVAPASSLRGDRSPFSPPCPVPALLSGGRWPLRESPHSRWHGRRPLPVPCGSRHFSAR